MNLPGVPGGRIPGRSLQDDVTQRRRVSDPPTQKKKKKSQKRETRGAAAQCFIQLLTAEGGRVAELKENTKRVERKKKKSQRFVFTMPTGRSCVGITRRRRRAHREEREDVEVAQVNSSD